MSGAIWLHLSVLREGTETTIGRQLKVKMNQQDFIDRVVQLTNEFRAKNGLHPLAFNGELTEAAQDHVNDMAHQDFFNHTGLDGSKPWDRAEDAGYDYQTVGENIAAGQITPKQVVREWIRSPGHRDNMLDDAFREIGVGYKHVKNDNGSINYNHYWAQVFGTEQGDDSDSAIATLSVQPKPNKRAGSLSRRRRNQPRELRRLVVDIDGEGTLQPIRSHAGRQDQQLDVVTSGDNDKVKFQGNGWKRLTIDYDIKKTTVLKVDFRSNAIGEIQGIGFDTNRVKDASDRGRAFQLVGTQRWGNPTEPADTLNDSRWYTYEIPVGEYFTGKMKYLTLINDHDVLNPTATSLFRNIELFEQTDGVGEPSKSHLNTKSNLNEIVGNQQEKPFSLPKTGVELPQ